jgi:hypothetical protein
MGASVPCCGTGAETNTLNAGCANSRFELRINEATVIFTAVVTLEMIIEVSDGTMKVCDWVLNVCVSISEPEIVKLENSGSEIGTLNG